MQRGIDRLQRLGSGSWDLSSVKLVLSDFGAMKQSLKEAAGNSHNGWLHPQVAFVSAGLARR
jgi:hypothetical protein